MKRGTLPGFTFFLMACGLSASLTVDAVAQSDGAAEFVTRYLAANGGAEALKSLCSMRMTGEMSWADGSSGELVYLNRYPFYERGVWKGQGKVAKRWGYDGAVSWDYTCDYLGRGTLHMSAARQMPIFDWTVYDAAACGASLEVLPDENADGAQFLRARAVFATGRVRDYWFEANGMRLARIVDTDGNGAKRFFVIDKSTRFNGIWFPQVMREVSAEGTLLVSVVIHDVFTNPGLLPDFATPPSYPSVVDGK
jgi:hypothetical protein